MILWDTRLTETCWLECQGRLDINCEINIDGEKEEKNLDHLLFGY